MTARRISGDGRYSGGKMTNGEKGETRSILGPMPDLATKLLMGPDEVAPYLDEDGVDYPKAGQVACAWTSGDMQMVSANPSELCSGSLEEALAYLTHEAVHCALAHMALIGEDEPGEEEIAYHVGSAAYGLFSDFFEWLGAR